jgi:hypothetical protein
LERESFGRQKGFVFLPITQVVDPADDPTSQHPVVQAEVQSIRTDLDRFSAVEINSLAQHGYEVARSVCRQAGTLGDAQLPDTPPWLPVPDGHPATTPRGTAEPRQPAAETLLSRQLRKSSRRRVWSKILDWRDWPSYVYVALAFVLLFYLPLQVYQLYRKSQTQSNIIKSIASGEPDIRRILELGTSDPMANWVAEEIEEKPERTEVSYEGVEIISHSRIHDLRHWDPDAESLDRQGHVYVHDRIEFNPSSTVGE